MGRWPSPSAVANGISVDPAHFLKGKDSRHFIQSKPRLLDSSRVGRMN